MNSINRRRFLKGLGGGAACVFVASAGHLAGKSAVYPDDFVRNGYRVRWAGWKEPSNQNVIVGMWMAKHSRQDLQWVSTTFGQCYPSRDWEVVDMSRADDSWPLLTCFSDASERDIVKHRALKVLLKNL